jgi:hypothetical protein
MSPSSPKQRTNFVFNKSRTKCKFRLTIETEIRDRVENTELLMNPTVIGIVIDLGVEYESALESFRFNGSLLQ